jgi:hypothetical protein
LSSILTGDGWVMTPGRKPIWLPATFRDEVQVRPGIVVVWSGHNIALLKSR